MKHPQDLDTQASGILESAYIAGRIDGLEDGASRLEMASVMVSPANFPALKAFCKHAAGEIRGKIQKLKTEGGDPAKWQSSK